MENVGPKSVESEVRVIVKFMKRDPNIVNGSGIDE